MYTNEAAQAGIAALYFLHYQAVFDVIHAGAAVPFQIRAKKTEVAHFADEVLGQAGVIERIADDGNYTVVHKLAGSVPHQ